jgi:hypothetical protein
MTGGCGGMMTSCHFEPPSIHSIPLSVVEALLGDFMHIRAKKWLDKMEAASAAGSD